jgi:hypothetical protein
MLTRQLCRRDNYFDATIISTRQLFRRDRQYVDATMCWYVDAVSSICHRVNMSPRPYVTAPICQRDIVSICWWWRVNTSIRRVDMSTRVNVETYMSMSMRQYEYDGDAPWYHTIRGTRCIVQEELNIVNRRLLCEHYTIGLDRCPVSIQCRSNAFAQFDWSPINFTLSPRLRNIFQLDRWHVRRPSLAEDIDWY